MNQAEIDDELVNFVIGMIDLKELARRVSISEAEAQELIQRRVHILDLPPPHKEGGADER